MAQTVGAHILQRLHGHGVQRIYGYPGDGINGILGGFHELGRPARVRPGAHEELAAFMACADAKFTGEVGVCLATSGPGAIHLLNGLYDAKLDHQPVGDRRPAGAARSARATSRRSISARCSRTSPRVRPGRPTPGQVTHLIDRAVQIARRDPLGHLRDRSLRPAGALRRSPRRVSHGALFAAGRCSSRASCRRRRPRRARRRCSTRASGRDPDRAGARGAATRSSEVADAAWRGRREGVERPRRPSRRPAVRHRPDRAAGGRPSD